MKSRGKLNAVTGFITQAIIIVLGLLVPRIIIVNYGSDTNGLTNTLTQIFSYIALLEAGIGQATRNALFQPIAEKNKTAICDVMSASRKYYWKVTQYYGLAVILMAVILPFILKTDLRWETVFFVVLFEGLSGVIRFMYTENWMQLLLAEGKGYVQANINLFTRILTYLVKIVMAYMGVSIVLIQIGYFCVSLVQLVIYKTYMNKNYNWLKYNSTAKLKNELKDKNAYVVTEVAWTVFSSTDMILLSILFSTALTSVYSVYNLVYSNISLLLNSVYSSLLYILGQTYHESMEKYKKVHDEFELLFMTAISVLMSCCSLLAIPFVRLYTNGVTDIEYIYIYLPFLFGLVQILSWDRYVSGNLSGIAGYARVVSVISAIEALTNIILSVVLSFFWGIYGVTIATAIALILKLVYLTYLGNKRILERSIKKTLSKILVYLIAYSAISIVGILKPIIVDNYFEFIVAGIIVLAFVSLIFICLAFLVDFKSTNNLLKRVYRGNKL